jgi:peptidoglycan hydrolase CwlO-like protein
METYKEQVLSESLHQMAESVAQLETENTRLKKDIDELVMEIAIANKFIKSQKEYYEKYWKEVKNK